MLIKKKREQHKNPEVELVARLLDRVDSEGSVSSPTPELWTAPKMVNGFLCQVEKFEDGWQGLAIKYTGPGKGFEMDKLSIWATREEADRELHKMVRAWK